MEEIRTVVTFESPAFNTTECRDNFINACCYGEDVAQALLQQLHVRGVLTDPEAGQEDFGWYLGYRVGDTDYQFVLGHRAADGSNPAVWIGWLERKDGLVGSLFGVRRRGVRPDGVTTIHSAISSLPQVSSIRWHRKEDFDDCREEFGQSDPLA